MDSSPNLILVGPMGAGKSSIGKRLAEHFDLRFVDVDEVVVERCGATIPTLFEHVGESGFRERESAALLQVLSGEGLLVSTGGGAVLDPRNRALMRERGFVVYLQVSVAGQLHRVGHDRNRPLLQRADRKQALQAMAAQRDPLYREVANLCFDTEKGSAAKATATLIEQLSREWPRPLRASTEQDLGITP